ncbi:hypothetical protein SPHINGO391_360067 [Sphingomonas aurantiaca]|uniref:Uncharacterized protein n=1 Tax=Sphingomonas aurantiaca TaxID=185949 RepID=A0A5E7YIW9_9SPHN|nr:hypothetical protein SPHINGO391_360067 [Sphingomonas aurantiaca]
MRGGLPLPSSRRTPGPTVPHTPTTARMRTRGCPNEPDGTGRGPLFVIRFDRDLERTQRGSPHQEPFPHGRGGQLNTAALGTLDPRLRGGTGKGAL